MIRSMTAVSYTHLDVYKRQPFSHGDFVVGKLHNRFGNGAAMELLGIAIDNPRCEAGEEKQRQSKKERNCGRNGKIPTAWEKYQAIKQSHRTDSHSDDGKAEKEFL